MTIAVDFGCKATKKKKKKKKKKIHIDTFTISLKYCILCIFQVLTADSVFFKEISEGKYHIPMHLLL